MVLVGSLILLNKGTAAHRPCKESPLLMQDTAIGFHRMKKNVMRDARFAIDVRGPLPTARWFP